MRNHFSIWIWAVVLLCLLPLYHSASAHPGATNAEGSRAVVQETEQ